MLIYVCRKKHIEARENGCCSHWYQYSREPIKKKTCYNCGYASGLTELEFGDIKRGKANDDLNDLFGWVKDVTIQR